MTKQLLKSIRKDRDMSKSNITTIQQLPAGQLIANIPKALCQALGWEKGDRIIWEIKEGKVVLSKETPT